jgi:tripartite-type tricarboxylate transporter receptor subunit TctC
MKSKTMKHFLLVLVVSIFGFLCIGLTNSWSAEKYPSRPVELVCGLAPGGASDFMNRVLAKYFEKYLGVSFVPINKPGPAQMMAASYVAKAAPDGYTIGQIANQIITAELTGQSSGYTMDELTPVCQISAIGLVLAVPADSPWKTFQDFLDYAKKNPGVKYGHHGVGSGPYTRMEIMNKYNKLGMIGIPLKGDGEIVPALLGKHVPIGVLSPVVAKEQVAAGKLRILFTWEHPSLDGLDPSTATLRSVLKNMPDIDTSIFLWVHKKTPDNILRTIEGAFVKMSKDPEFVSDLKKLNYTIVYVDHDALVKKVMAEKIAEYKEALGYLGTLKK